MHVLIATDGTLDHQLATPFASALAGGEGSVTVLTVIEVNRNLLRDLRALYGEQLAPRTDQDAEYVGIRSPGSGGPLHGWPGDDEMIQRYLDDQRDTRTGPLASALEAAGLSVAVLAKEGEDPALAIIEAIEELGADVVCVGAQGSGIFDTLLGSTGTRLTRRSPRPVLVLRSQ